MRETLHKQIGREAAAASRSKPRAQFRDQTNGQFAMQNNWDRMCVCGHVLGSHCAGGFDCLHGTGAEMPRAPGEHCDCQKFRQSRKKT